MGGSDALSIFPTDLYGRLGTAGSPLLFDVRRAAAFEADETLRSRGRDGLATRVTARLSA